MSYRQVSRVIYGFRIEKKTDRWNEEYAPYIEGHPGIDVLMFSNEEEINVWYCGIVLASSDDGFYKEIITSTQHDVQLYEFAKKFSLNTDVPAMYMLNMQV